jgi:hypothetical protein
VKAIRFSLFWLFETISLCCLCLSLSLPLSFVYLSSILNHVFQSPFLPCDLARFFHERIWVRILTPPHVARNDSELGFGCKKIFQTLTFEIFYTPKPINFRNFNPNRSYLYLKTPNPPSYSTSHLVKRIK